MVAGSIHLCLIWILISYVFSVNVYLEFSEAEYLEYFTHLSQVYDQFEYRASKEEDFENGALLNPHQLLANLSLNQDEILLHYILRQFRYHPLALLPLFVACSIFLPASYPLKQY